MSSRIKSIPISPYKDPKKVVFNFCHHLSLVYLLFLLGPYLVVLSDTLTSVLRVTSGSAQRTTVQSRAGWNPHFSMQCKSSVLGAVSLAIVYFLSPRLPLSYKASLCRFEKGDLLGQMQLGCTVEQLWEQRTGTSWSYLGAENRHVLATSILLASCPAVVNSQQS